MPQGEQNYCERRDKLRLPLNRRVRLDSPTEGDLQLNGIDYSPSGIAVACPTRLPIGEQVVVCFPVGRNQQTELEVHGEIVHHHVTNEDFILGIRFMEWLKTSSRPGF